MNKYFTSEQQADLARRADALGPTAERELRLRVTGLQAKVATHRCRRLAIVIR
jgi:hypothetical protein